MSSWLWPKTDNANTKLYVLDVLLHDVTYADYDKNNTLCVHLNLKERGVKAHLSFAVWNMEFHDCSGAAHNCNAIQVTATEGNNVPFKQPLYHRDTQQLGICSIRHDHAGFAVYS
jgi:hypothetical protein